MDHVVGSVVMNAMVHAVELTGVQDDPSKRQSAALCLAKEQTLARAHEHGGRSSAYVQNSGS